MAVLNSYFAYGDLMKEKVSKDWKPVFLVFEINSTYLWVRKAKTSIR